MEGKNTADSAPQISLEHILALDKVEKCASALKEEAKAKYEADITAMADAKIQRKKRFVFFGREYDILGRRFFRIEGEYKTIEREAFERIMQSYPPALGKVGRCARSLGNICDIFENIKERAAALLGYVSSLESGEKQEEEAASDEVQLRLFEEPLPMPAEKEITGYIDTIFGLVEDYNSAVAGLVPDLPEFGEQEAGTEDLASDMDAFNSCLRSIRQGFYTVETIKRAALLKEKAAAIASALRRIKSSWKPSADFNGMRWGSENFATYAQTLGFQVVNDKKLYKNRAYRPKYAVRWVQD